MRKSIVISIFLFCLQLVNAQDSAKTQWILHESCGCINKISLFSTIDIKNDSIKKCIDFANKHVQILSGTEEKDLNDSLKNGLANKDFTLFQEKLLKECAYLKKLVQYDNSQFNTSVSENKKALDFYKKGVQYAEKEQCDLALVEFNKAVKKDSKLALAWNKMGICYRKLKKYQEAVNCYKKVLELDPKGDKALMNLGVAYEMLQDHKSASEVYAKYIEYYPQDPEGFYCAARMYYIAKNYEKGLNCAFQAYSIYKKTGSIYIKDAEATIRGFYNDMAAQNQLEVFNKIADKYNNKTN
ncbi:MAG: tetratricopeptide repeat protein [Flavobacterium sp.]